MDRPKREVELPTATLERLRGPLPGSGGYQTLILEIRQRLNGDRLAVDDDIIERVEHYAYDYGRGGWQLLLRELLDCIEAATPRQ